MSVSFPVAVVLLVMVEVNLPIQSSSWALLPVFLPGCRPVPSPSVERVCCRCVLNTLGLDAAYLELIVMASAPLACQPGGDKSCRANQRIRSGQVSQSSPSFALSDRPNDQSE